MYDYYDHMEPISFEVVHLVRNQRLMPNRQTRYRVPIRVKTLRLFLMQDNRGARPAELICKTKGFEWPGMFKGFTP